MTNRERIIMITVLCIAAVLVMADFRAWNMTMRAGHTAPLSTENGNPASARTESDFYSGVPSPSVLPKTASTSPSATVSVPPDVITAWAYLVGDVRTGKVYMEKNSQDVLPIASMSKLLTAITSTDTMSPTTTVEVTEPETLVYPDASALRAGEKFTAHELLYPMLLDSSNVAAEALASSTDRAHFLNLMNSFAWELGMTHTYFGDPSGLTSHNESTASDLFLLARYLYLDRPDILAITRTVETSVGTTTDHGAHIFASIHPFVRDPRFIGGKTGHTDAAADTMMTILNLGGNPIAIIVLHSVSGDRAHDTSILASKAAAILASPR